MLQAAGEAGAVSPRLSRLRDLVPRTGAASRPVNRYLFDAAILAALAFAVYQLTTLGRALMATQEQVDALTAQVTDLDARVGKIGTEVKTALDTQAVLVAEVADLKAQLAAGNAVDLSGLEAAVANVGTAIAAVDDLIPDAPTAQPDA